MVQFDEAAKWHVDYLNPNCVVLWTDLRPEHIVSVVLIDLFREHQSFSWV